MNIIFLDIDGPMIPAVMYLSDNLCGIERRFPVHTIAVLNEMCRKTEARVVINSTHNRSFGDDIPLITDALISHGFKAGYLHPEHRHTRYPDLPRKEAVKNWLNAHFNPDTDDWIAIDDVDFLHEYKGHEHPNMCWVEPDLGIGIKHLNQVCRKFGASETMFFM